MHNVCLAREYSCCSSFTAFFRSSRHVHGQSERKQRARPGAITTLFCWQRDAIDTRAEQSAWSYVSDSEMCAPRFGHSRLHTTPQARGKGIAESAPVNRQPRTVKPFSARTVFPALPGVNPGSTGFRDNPIGNGLQDQGRHGFLDLDVLRSCSGAAGLKQVV